MFKNLGPVLKTLAAGAVLAISLAVSALPARAQDDRKAVYHPTPTYPEAAKKLAIVGTVKLHIVIAPDGHIKETKVIGGHPVLVAAAEETVKTWKYSPASSETTTTLEFRFNP